MSLFSGVGCVDKAAADLGMGLVATAEIEPFPCRVLEERFPGVPNLGDVRTIDPYEVARTHGRVDVISGGFPCQDLSVAGKRRGLAGDRSGLFWEFVRICRGIAPTWVILENVPGLLSSNEGRDFALILDALGELGYGLSWRVLNAQHFGVPQRRRRVFIVGYLGGPCPPEILFESQGVQRHLAESGEEGQEVARSTIPSVASTLGGGSGNRGWADDTDRATFIPTPAPDNGRSPENSEGDAKRGLLVPEVAGGLTTRYGKGVNTTADDGAVIPVAFNWQASGADWMNPHQERTDALHAGQTPAVAQPIPFDTTQITSDKNYSRPREGDPDHPLAAGAHPPAAVIQGGAEQDQFVKAEGISPTLAHSSNSHQGHHQPKYWEGMAVRRLTPTECARLSGMPDWWTDVEGASDSAKYRAWGNAIVYPVAKFILGRIKEVHEKGEQ